MDLFTRSHIEPIDPGDVPILVSEGYVGQCVQVATATVLVYDTITTMDKEARYFWKKILWGSVNIVYFVNRYVGLFGSLAGLIWYSYGVNLAMCEQDSFDLGRKAEGFSFELGNFTTWTVSIADWFIVVSIDYILMIRVLALYSNDKQLSICLRILIILEAIIKFGILTYYNLSEKIAVGALAQNYTACGADGIPSWHLAIFSWIIPFCYAIILLILALYKAAEYWRTSYGFNGFALVKVVIQDQILYFLVALICSVVNIIQFRVFGSNVFVLFLLQTIGSPSFLCVLGSRMLFNLREADELGLNQGTNYRMSSLSCQSVSEMEFTDRNDEDNGSQWAGNMLPSN